MLFIVNLISEVISLFIKIDILTYEKKINLYTDCMVFFDTDVATI